MDLLEDPTVRQRAMSIASIITNTMEGVCLFTVNKHQILLMCDIDLIAGGRGECRK